MRKRGCMITAYMLLAAALLTGCGKSERNPAEEIQERGVLRVAVPDTASTFLYQDDETGEYLGIEADIVTMLADMLTVDVEYIAAERNVFINKLSIGEADIAIGSIAEGSFVTAGYSSSVSYGGESIYMVTPRGMYAGDLTVFTDKTVGISSQANSGFSSIFYTVDGITVQSYDNINSVISDLENEKIDGYACYQLEAEELLSRGDYQVQDVPGAGRENFVILAANGSDALIEGIDVLILQYLTAQQEQASQSPM